MHSHERNFYNAYASGKPEEVKRALQAYSEHIKKISNEQKNNSVGLARTLYLKSREGMFNNFVNIGLPPKLALKLIVKGCREHAEVFSDYLESTSMVANTDFERMQKQRRTDELSKKIHSMAEPIKWNDLPAAKK